eukprot:3893593-Pyramimonas_sp.AAC.1
MEIAASSGNVAVEGSVRRFTNGSGERREPEWTQGHGETSARHASTSVPRIEASGTRMATDRNDGNRFESAAVFAKPSPFVETPETERFNMELRKFSVQVLAMLLSDAAPQRQQRVPTFISDSEVGSDAWSEEVADFYASSLGMLSKGDDFLFTISKDRFPDWRYLNGGGSFFDEEHWAHLFPPPLLFEAYFAATGRRGAITAVEVLSRAYFLKRRLEWLKMSGSALDVPGGSFPDGVNS